MDLRQFIVDLLSLGSLYALLGLGFVVVYRTSRVLNFAHPGFVLLGAYLFVAVYRKVGESLPVTVAVMLALGATIGLATYLVVMRPMSGQSRIATIMVTVALLFILGAVVQVFWKGQTTFIPLPGSSVAWELAGQRVRMHDALLLGGATILLGGLLIFYRFSRLGIYMRAVAENAVLAARRGLNIDRIVALSWALAVALAFVAGPLAGAKAPISPSLIGITLKAFAVPLVGGLDSVKGLVPGALLVTSAELLTIEYFGSALAEAAPFVVLLVVMIARPWGLFGTPEELHRV